MKIHLGFFLGLSAFSLAACAAFFSIFGLSQLFAGAAISVIIMASILEVSKLIIATYLHSYWDTISKIMKIYLTSGVVILAFITSAGIYGYLSNAYQITANTLEVHDGKINIIQSKIDYFKKTLESNTKLVDSKTNRMDQLVLIRTKQDSRLDVSNNRSNKNNLSNTGIEIEKLNKEIDELNVKNTSISDSIGKYTTLKIEISSNSKVSGEIGPLKYMSEVSGLPMNKIVNYFILLLVFVFDPLAISLVIATNSVFESKRKRKEPVIETKKEKGEEIKEPVKELKKSTTDSTIKMKRDYIGGNLEDRNFSKPIPRNTTKIEK